MDKDGLGDIASMTQVTVDGQPGYQIRSANLLDVFDFDFHPGAATEAIGKPTASASTRR